MEITQLTLLERQNLINQFEILYNLTKDTTYEVKAEILRDGYEGLYYEVFTGTSTSTVPKEVSDETDNILQLYRRIDNAVARLSPEEQAQLDIEKIKFEGFDGNNDDHFGYMTFVVEKMDKWSEYKDGYLNSHSSVTINKYRRMIEAYNALGGNNLDELGFNELNAIINAA